LRAIFLTGEVLDSLELGKLGSRKKRHEKKITWLWKQYSST